MSISSGLLGLWQEVARSDSWATESRSARCAEDWTAEAGKASSPGWELVVVGGGESGLSEGAAQHARVALSRGCAHGSQRSNAAQAVHSRGGGERRGLRELLRRRGDDGARLFADAVLRGASVGRVEAQLQGRSQMEMSWQSQTLSGWIHRRT